MDKEAIRYEMIEMRDAMTARQARELSDRICSRILGMPAIADAKSVAIYISFRNEVHVEKLLPALVAKGKKVFAPVVFDQRDMKFAPLTSMADTTMGNLGTHEPTSKAFAKDGEIDAFVAPGLAYDMHGFRVGWGHGYYDGFLSHLKKAVKIGAAYDFQVVDKLDAEAHDVKMDFVATESRVIKF